MWVIRNHFFVTLARFTLLLDRHVAWMALVRHLWIWDLIDLQMSLLVSHLHVLWSLLRKLRAGLSVAVDEVVLVALHFVFFARFKKNLGLLI